MRSKLIITCAAVLISAGHAIAAPWCDEADIVDQYACLIKEAGQGASNDPVKQQFYTAIEAANVVQTIASSARYSKWSREEGFKSPQGVAEICLGKGYGICGNQMMTFLTLMKKIGMEARPVQMWYMDDGERVSHATTEVRIDGKWRFFDVTWGSFWLADPKDITSVENIDEVRAGKGQRITADTNVWYLSRRLAGTDVFTYATNDDVDVNRNFAGPVTFRFELGAEEKFKNRPNWVGDRVKDGQEDRLFFKLEPKADTFGVQLAVDRYGYCHDSKLAVGDKTYDLTTQKFTVEATGLTPGATVSITPGDDQCIVGFKSITLLTPSKTASK